MYYDVKIFEAINGLANSSKVIDLLGIFLADYLPYLLGAFLLSFLFWPKKDRVKNRVMVVVSIVSALIARLVVKNVILLFYDRPRPYIAFPLSHKLIATSIADNFQSFPSGHTIFFFALSTVIYFFNKKLGIFFLICSAIMGLARIFVGVHWPSDILGGAVLGIMVGVMIWYIAVDRKGREKSC